jgi:sarcosine oxidase gamma subunit
MKKGAERVMRRTVAILLALTFLLATGVPPARADGKSRLAREAADYVMQRFGRQAVKEGAETLAARIENYAARHGEEFIQAVKKVGPGAFQLVEEAGEHGPQVAGILARHGEPAAVWVVSRPQAMKLFLQHGEEAAAVLAKTSGVAEPAIQKLGKPAISAFESLGTGQNVRRLAMVASEGGELTAIGHTPELLGVISKYGDPAMDFVWRHKGVLASGVVLTAFLANPEPFISGAKDITQVVAENTVKPIAEVPATVAREAAGEVARGTNWTIVFALGVLAAGGLVALRMRLKTRHSNP